MGKNHLQSLVEKITRDIMADLEKESNRKKVLFIFCDSSAHETFSDQLIAIKNDNIDHDLLFLDGETSAWLGNHQIQSTGSKQIIAADEYAKAPIELPKDYDAIIMPEIDLDSAARVCNGLKGSVKAEIIFAALIINKIVIIGDESSCIKRSDRRTLQTINVPFPYQKRFDKYKLELKEMGIHFCKQVQLQQTLVNLLFLNEVNETQLETYEFSGKALTENWLSSNQINHKTLFIKEGTIITPLAKDYLNAKRIKLIHSRSSHL